ncbi:MAG: PA14 domain-containing protein [Pirellulales bacterium]
MTFRYLKPMAVVAVVVTIAGLGTAKAADLVGTDIGNPLRPGSTVKTGNAYTVKGGGSDIWNQTDQFQFASADQTGDFVATVRLDRMRAADAWTKGGLMARETLYRGSRDMFEVITPANGIALQWRPDTGVGATWGNVPLQGSFYSTYGSVWMLLKREGNIFTGAWAPDAGGVPGGWLSPQTFDSGGKFPDTLKVGLCLTSHDNNQLTRAVFSSYNIEPVDPANPVVFDTPQAYGELVTLPGGKLGGKAFGLTETAQAVFGPASWNVRKSTLVPAGATGLKSEWFNGNNNFSNLMFTIVQPNIDWKDSGAPGYPAGTGWGTSNHDNYSVRLSGEINLPTAGTYTFRDANDDYAKLMINGETLIDDGGATGYGGEGALGTGTGTITVDTPGWYPIEFLMAEGGGGDSGQLKWDAGVPGQARTVVPAENFHTVEDVMDSTLVVSGRGNIGNLTTNGQFGDVTVENGATYTLNIGVGYGLTGAYEQVLGGAGSPAAVPEPSTMVLAGLGFVGLLAYGWRRRTLA